MIPVLVHAPFSAFIFIPITSSLMLLNKQYFLRLHCHDEQLKNRMLMAVPKKGRLYDQCVKLLERCGIKVGRG